MSIQILSEKKMYNALLRKDSEFEGQFFAAIKTTGIFCRPSCTARKPKLENVEFYFTVREALANGYRPCKVCKPLIMRGEIPQEIKKLFNELENDPSLKITDYGLVKRGIEPSKVRRWFLKNHNMTFQAYQRLFRINNAFNKIKNGEKVINAAYDNGYDSLSGFGHSFRKATEVNPAMSFTKNLLTYERFSTPIGPMMAIASGKGVCLLEFTDRRKLETELKQIRNHYKSNILPGKNKIIDELKFQLEEYFAGKRKKFSIPVEAPGSEFQKNVWKILMTIPYGETRSYKKQAELLGNPKAVRAVANANGANRISIIIPCHRVIGEDGKLTGYGGGLWRKNWLLNLEGKNKN